MMKLYVALKRTYMNDLIIGVFDSLEAAVESAKKVKAEQEFDDGIDTYEVQEYFVNRMVDVDAPTYQMPRTVIHEGKSYP